MPRNPDRATGIDPDDPPVAVPFDVSADAFLFATVTAIDAEDAIEQFGDALTDGGQIDVEINGLPATIEFTDIEADLKLHAVESDD